MAYFIPTGIQRRLLRYALSKLELLDTDGYDLENLDITLGRTNNVELHNVGLRTDKLASLLALPPALRLEVARVLLLRITVQADLWNPSIAVDIQGVRVTVRLDKAAQHLASDKRKRRRSSASRRDGIPTTEDIAKSFLAEEPPQDKRELEDVLLSQSRKLGDSDMLSDDGSGQGTGVAVTLPSFLANYLQGVQDRLRVSIHDVEFELKAELDGAETTFDQPKPSDISFTAHCDTLGLEGVTSAGEQPVDDAGRRAGKRHVTLQQFTVDLVSDASVFANLSRAPSVVSRSPSQPRSPQATRSDGSRSGPRSTTTSSPSESSASRWRRKSLEQASPGSSRGSVRMQRKGSLEALLRQRPGMSDSERFADASDDGLSFSNMDAAAGRSPVMHPTLFAQPPTEVESGGHWDGQWGLDVPDDDPTGPGARMSQSEADVTNEASVYDMAGTGSAIAQADPAASQQIDRLALRQGRLSATFPSAKVSTTGEETLLGLEERPISRSQPTSGCVVGLLPTGEDSTQHLAPSELPTSNRSSSPASTGSESSNGSSAGLSESKLFSHEDAESMYMSAFSEAPDGQSGSMAMPGGWDGPEGVPESFPAEFSHAERVEAAEEPYEEEDALTPRAISPNLAGEVPSTPAAPPPLELPAHEPVTPPLVQPSHLGRVAKNVLSLAKVDVWVPIPRHHEDEVPEVASTPEDMRLSSMYRQTPGAFSVHQAHQHDAPKASQSTAFLSDSLYESADPHTEKEDGSIEVKVGFVETKLDIPVARILLQLLKQVQEVFKADGSDQTSGQEKDPKTQVSLPLFTVLVERLALRCLDQLALRPSGAKPLTESQIPENSDLFRMDIGRLEIASRAGNEFQLNIGSLTSGMGGHQVLSFRRASRTTNVEKSPHMHDLELTYKVRASGIEVGMLARPVQLDVDVQRIDEALSCFGGLSGVLELSSSISSASAPLSSPTRTTPQRTRGVRFVGEPRQEQTTPLSGVKINAHIRGLNVLLTGQSCGLSLETTSIKLVGRERGISTSFSQLRLAGPYFDAADTVAPLNLQLEGVRIDFLFTPEETDLTKLVSLITPSRDKYDDDDDVLLDTLLRQRQKGSLIRVSANVFNFDLSSLAAVAKLQCLGDELSKIQNVAKYFPEDDRPGLLTMLTIGHLTARVPTERSLGVLQIDAHGLRLGHVSIPPLLATSVDQLSLTHGSNVQLVSEVLHREVVDVPMLMVRMISDEMVPTIRVKLHNLCAEYRVPTIIALMGLQEDATADDLSASIAMSVATITRQTSGLGLRATETGAGSPLQAGKSVHIEVLFRDCAVGLNPQALPSKALFLLSDAKFHSKVPVDTAMSASLELRKAYLLVSDNVEDLSETADHASRAVSVTGSRHVLELCQKGYVSVGTLSKAQISLRSWEDDPRTKLAEVNVRNELFVMESCADSTQTLISLLGALAPPSPPSKADRYRTKVVPMEDMMASFTGTPVVEPQSAAELSGDEDEDDFDLPVDMIGSFYAPDDPEDDIMADPIDAVPHDNELGQLRTARAGEDGAAWTELGERCRVSSSKSEFVYEENYYGRQAGTKAMARDWDSRKNEYGIASKTKVEKSPLRVHLHELHFIWNLFDGYDWARTRQTIEKAVHDVEIKAEERRRGKRTVAADDEDNEEVIGDFLFNSIWIEVPANKDPRELARTINRDVDDLASETGSYATMTTHTNSPTRASATQSRRRRLRLHRSRQRKITFELSGVSADVYVFPSDSGETQSSVDVRVGNLEIFDHVPSSTWKKFATYMKDAGERELDRPMVRLELLDVKPVEGLAASEAVLRVSVLPLRLHVDQDALDFITRFFEFKDDSATAATPSGPAPFIQRIEINTVFVKLDYKPKKVDYAGIRSGHTTEFMNFFILDDCDIVLRHCIVYGVSGFDRLHKTLNDIWMPDVKRNQLPTVLAGLAPVRPIVNVTSGVRDLVYIPLREYNKDGRIVRSVQKGAVAFARTTTSELARLGAKLAIGTQNVLQGAEDMLSPSPLGTPRRHADADWDDNSYPFSTSPGAPDESEERRAISSYADQPIGVVAGLRSAARSLERDLLTARDAIVAIPGEVMESEGAGGAVGVVARRAPTVILRTARGASKAVGVALLGAGNALDPESRRKVEEKYKRY